MPRISYAAAFPRKRRADLVDQPSVSIEFLGKRQTAAHDPAKLVPAVDIVTGAIDAEHLRLQDVGEIVRALVNEFPVVRGESFKLGAIHGGSLLALVRRLM